MRPRLLLLLSCLTGCLSPNGGGTATVPEEQSTGGETTASVITTGPSEPGTSTGPDDETTTTDPSTTGPGECGDGVMSGDEECDDGPDNADDAACLTTCKTNVCGDGFVLAGSETCDDQNQDDDDDCVACAAASCGDGHVQTGVEACDDGVNDNGYDGCSADCSALGPHCGDGLFDPRNEECDDPANEACLSSCKVATSCLKLHEADPGIASGTQMIYPNGPGEPVAAYCDMTSDGGGYTFLKFDVESDENNLPFSAASAEVECAKFGMQLWIPRSSVHLLSGYSIAISENVFPQGGGGTAAGSDYLRILGIYPVTKGVSCPGEALTPTDCPEWDASDNKDWYVSDVSVVATEPDSDPDATCTDCSMSYLWNGDGTVKSYKTVAYGAASFRFMCDVGDKLP